ncbi:Uncharacterised protein [Enterobacter asburiae]|uniref:Uncharacterized protein n=1 Tax=Enterobacter asburiae TaxID=61645 RepID=A0A376F756_ENTAS|nr:Uncharacterised protein [Enterobacter asburiae]
MKNNRICQILGIEKTCYSGAVILAHRCSFSCCGQAMPEDSACWGPMPV